AGGSVTNDSGGYINGLAAHGIGPAGATVTNFGTIAGISLDANCLFVIEGGSKLVGTAASNGAVLELGSAGGNGTLYGFGATVTNFSTLQFDSGAKWTVEGNTAG